MGSTNERARLAHDHEHLAGVDGDLARAAAAGQPGLRVVVVADDRRVDVAEPVDLGGAQEPDVDEPALQVVAEQLEHADDGGRAGDDRRVADAQRQALRPRPEHAGLVDQLEVGATVRWARLTAMFGSPTPTKQTRWPSRARAAATIIISDLLNGRSASILLEV